MTRQHMGLDEETFGRLDVDGDGSLDAEELARFAARPPDVELTLRLGARGERKAVEISDGDRPLSSHLRAEKDGATLDLDTTRIDFRTASGEEVMRSPLTSRQLYKGQFTNADQDGNGYLDKAEADRSPLFRDAFRLMDRDGDGKVFEKEML